MYVDYFVSKMRVVVTILLCIFVRTNSVCLSPVSNMKFLPHAKLEVLKPSHEKEREYINSLLVECNYDVDLWCTRLGFILVRDSSLLEEPFDAIIFGERMTILKGLTTSEEIELIKHEYAHFVFHAPTVAYQMLNRFQINHDEAEAEAFARTEKEFFT